MNTLFIIGTGFDLAHGLKTSYADFLFWEFKRNIGQLNNLISERNFVFYKLKKLNSIELYDEIVNNFSTISDILSSHSIILKYSNTNDHRNRSNESLYNIMEIEFASDFFENILSYSNWKDLESAYFSKLCEIHQKFIVHKLKAFDDIVSHSNKNKLNEIKQEKLIKPINKLNEDWDKLKSSLKEYLIEIDSKFNHENLVFLNILKEAWDYASDRNGSMLVLNFNYTSVVDSAYLSKFSKIHHVQIHGSLKNKESIIFGYGDDSHPKYAELEEEDENCLLQEIKSFYYPSTNQYQKMLEFLDDSEVEGFEVRVLGHSLGNSDRVLLKTIFEHERCKSVRLYHRNDEEFKEKATALSCHFSDKLKFRKLLIPKHNDDRI